MVVSFGGARPLLVLVFTLLAAGCAGNSRSAATLPPPSARSNTIAAKPSAPLPSYRFIGAGSETEKRDAQGSLELLRSGDRLLVSPSGSLAVASMRASEMLMGAVPVPARFGGGFLFWTGDVLYRARTFTGPLEAVAPVPTNVLGVAFGYDSVLVSSEDNYRRQYRLDGGARTPLTPRNVLEIAASDDGRVIALDASGRALASTDRGVTFRDVSAELRGIVGLRGGATEACFELAGDTRACLMPDGALSKGPAPKAPPRPPFDRERHQREELLERAVSDGVWLPAERVAVAKGNQVWLVDLVRRELLGAPRTVAPAGFECEALSAADSLLLACFEPKGEVVIVSHALDDARRSEKRFEGAPRVAYADEIVAVAAACDGKPREGVACERKPDARWLERDLGAQLTATAAPSPARLTLFVPNQGGDVAALVAHDAGNDKFEHWELVGVGPAPIKLDQDLPPLVLHLHQHSYGENGRSHTYAKRVDTSFVVSSDRMLRGFARQRSFSVTPQGKVSLHERVFDDLARRSGRALGREKDHSLWQSLDFGATWSKVAGPPYHEPGPFTPGADCSEVGCFLGSWLRQGWPREPVRAEPVFARAPSLDGEPPPIYPRLECAAAGPAQRLRAVAPPGEGYHDHSQGRSLNGMYGPLRASLEPKLRSGATRRNQAPPPRFSLSITEPFDSLNHSTSARVAPANWAAAWKDKASGLPSEGGARPLLSAEPGHAAGVLLVDSSERLPFWVRAPGTIRPLPHWKSRREPVNGYVDAGGKLWLASSDCSGRVRVADADSGVVRFELGPARPVYDPRRERSEAQKYLPPCPGFTNPDAIAVGPQGQMAVLRLPSGNDPATIDDPALVLAPGAEPIALAPWSTLELGSSTACASSKDGYRALIQTPYAWLGNERRGGAAPGMSAIVRWSTERVCLEAVETPQGDALLVARFVGKKPGAARISWQSQDVRREAVTCQLSVATAPP